MLKTVLFTDIAGSTEHAVRMGDGAGTTCSTPTTPPYGSELERFRGQEVKSTGDGFLACFDGPARAIRCAEAIGEKTHRIGLDVRVRPAFGGVRRTRR